MKISSKTLADSKNSRTFASLLKTSTLEKEVWRDGRVVDCGGLENRCTARYRGFESLSLRKKWVRKHSYPLFLCLYPSIYSPSRNLKTPSRFEVNVSTFLSIPLHLIASAEHFLYPACSLTKKVNVMNRYEWKVKWEWVSIILLVILLVALLMHP